MSETRSPRDRLRAIRAGRVSQLLDREPSDGLPPTEPPRLKLNGKPVTTGAAFDAVMEDRHEQRLISELAKPFANNSDSRTKHFSKATTTTQPGSLSPAQIAANTVTAIWGTNLPGQLTRYGQPIINGLGAAMAAQRNLDFLERIGEDPWSPSQTLSETRTETVNATEPSIFARAQAQPSANDNRMAASVDPLSVDSTLDETTPDTKIQISVSNIQDINLLFRKGNELTQRKNDYVAQQIKERLDKCFEQHQMDAETEHQYGGSDPNKKERYFQDPRATSTRGSGSTDGSVRIKIGDSTYYVDFQTFDELADGSPTSREMLNLEKLFRLKNVTNEVLRGEYLPDDINPNFYSRPGVGETLDIYAFGKGRPNTEWDDWQKRVDEELDQLFEDCQPIHRFKMEIPTDLAEPPVQP